ncbi:unnamed protein product [Protopolystoma xenopodis]|uniref:Uncharacterized protein n=1 Tax=Protopolystoma xenopodis TaxID=117903 RepID=A0A448X3F5_9PLAT|nr:unnamed protein product [Protopolystoma xenopodis]
MYLFENPLAGVTPSYSSTPRKSSERLFSQPYIEDEQSDHGPKPFCPPPSHKLCLDPEHNPVEIDCVSISGTPTTSLTPTPLPCHWTTASPQCVGSINSTGATQACAVSHCMITDLPGFSRASIDSKPNLETPANMDKFGQIPAEETEKPDYQCLFEEVIILRRRVVELTDQVNSVEQVVSTDQ